MRKDLCSAPEEQRKPVRQRGDILPHCLNTPATLLSMSASTLTHRVHRTQGLIPDHDTHTHTQRKAHSLAQTHLYGSSTITWLLMSCLHTNY